MAPLGNIRFCGPNLKKSLIAPCQNGNIVVKSFQDVCQPMCQIRVSYNLDISNFFLPTYYEGPKPKFREKKKFGPKKFPDFETPISQQHFFIIWQDGQKAINYFPQTSTQMTPLGNSQFWGLDLKKNSLIALCQNGNIVMKNFQHLFWQSS